MAQSYRTLREDVVANRSARSERLRVVERLPFPGDHHPLSKSKIEKLLRLVPQECLHGLRRIELRPRNHEIGSPFAVYRQRERAIILFSLTSEWMFRASYPGLASEVRQAGAVVSMDGKGMQVSWSKPQRLRMWFFFDVLGHEIGHHFEHQFVHKNGRSPGRTAAEAFAELSSSRLRERVRQILRERKRTNQALQTTPVTRSET